MRYKNKKYENTCSYYFYRDFTLSRKWLDFRDYMLKKCKYECELCGRGGVLNVHHRDLDPANYTNLSNPNNFRVLCRECHEIMHKLNRSETVAIDDVVIEQLRLSFLRDPANIVNFIRRT